ncbi:Cna B-type domain-containing protein [Catenibacterium sp. AM22-6LB]|nr:Cna B-type domain-containing protein [Catenibacterium sp. AM22-6LB]
MDKSLKKIILCFTVILSVAVFNLFQVTAVDVNKNCSLTLNECLSGLNVHLYRVASVSKDGSYEYTDEFKDAGNTSIDLNKLETSEELKNAAMTLKGYAANKEGVTKTTASSTLTYSNLNTGLYLVVADNLVIDGKTYTYLPYLISLPQGTKYDVSINFVKYSEAHSHEYKMIKQWKDNGSTHPNSIEVELYDGNTFVKTITLDAAHNYAYSWKTEQVMNYSIKERMSKGIRVLYQ